MTVPGAIPDPVPEPLAGAAPDLPAGRAPETGQVSTPGPVPVHVSRAYGHCEHVVRTRARNFAYGIRLLPPPKRRALSTVYALARRIDDVGDEAGPVAERLERLEQERRRLRALKTPPLDFLGPDSLVPGSMAGGRMSADVAADPVMVALGDAAARFPLPLGAFEELIDGCAADVAGARYRCHDDLVGYCRQVAGSIGRLSLGVFGLADGALASGGGERTLRRAAARADALGVALQLTNILRDLREDRCADRIYLPADDLRRFGCTLGLSPRGDFTDPPERLAGLIRFEAALALGWYAEGMRLIPLLDRRSAACTAAMADIYRRLLGRIAADPARVLAGRLSLAPWVKAMVAARALTGGAQGEPQGKSRGDARGDARGDSHGDAHGESR
ncbi:phytoene/squalene synthase family protein [Microbispora amethystogenes]|uniref:Phytoene synthase n=1 Tax=Microbispora amethystogenes TaxID=1427754 RepID=A0ABQ4FKV0_9ACTN|nr:squalene/phytoene synthase family protein [Microbispora amethystogenes]GIH35444.1 phytoene synthase [Microbispora amethystogenes]